MLTFLMKNDYILGNLSKKEMTLAWSMTEKRLNICFEINDYVTFYEIKEKQTLEICLSHFFIISLVQYIKSLLLNQMALTNSFQYQ